MARLLSLANSLSLFLSPLDLFFPISLFICPLASTPLGRLSGSLCLADGAALLFPFLNERQILIEPMLTMFADILYLTHHLLGKLFYKQIIATAAAAANAAAAPDSFPTVQFALYLSLTLHPTTILHLTFHEFISFRFILDLLSFESCYYFSISSPRRLIAFVWSSIAGLLSWNLLQLLLSLEGLINQNFADTK